MTNTAKTTRFVKSNYGRDLAVKLGLEVTEGYQMAFCSCGCGKVIASTKGYLVSSTLSTKELKKQGLLTNSCFYNGLF